MQYVYSMCNGGKSSFFNLFVHNLSKWFFFSKYKRNIRLYSPWPNCAYPQSKKYNIQKMNLGYLKTKWQPQIENYPYLQISWLPKNPDLLRKVQGSGTFFGCRNFKVCLISIGSLSVWEKRYIADIADKENRLVHKSCKLFLKII